MYSAYISANKLLTSLSKYLGALGIRQQALLTALLWNTLGVEQNHLAQFQFAEMQMSL